MYSFHTDTHWLMAKTCPSDKEFTRACDHENFDEAQKLIQRGIQVFRTFKLAAYIV